MSPLKVEILRIVVLRSWTLFSLDQAAYLRGTPNGYSYSFFETDGGVIIIV